MSDNKYLYYRPKNNNYARWKRIDIKNESSINNIITFDTHQMYTGHTDKLVVYFEANYADEFDVKEVGIYSFSEWFKILEYFDNNPNAEFEIYFGTNEFLEINKHTFTYIKTRPISGFKLDIVNEFELENCYVLSIVFDKIMESMPDNNGV